MVYLSKYMAQTSESTVNSEQLCRKYFVEYFWCCLPGCCYCLNSECCIPCLYLNLLWIHGCLSSSYKGMAYYCLHLKEYLYSQKGLRCCKYHCFSSKRVCSFYAPNFQFHHLCCVSEVVPFHPELCSATHDSEMIAYSCFDFITFQKVWSQWDGLGSLRCLSSIFIRSW